jgi:subtilisin family serine protease
VGRIIPLSGTNPGWLWASLKTKQAQFQLKASASGSVVDATYPSDVREIIIPPASMVDGPAVVKLWDQFRQARELELEAVRLVEAEIGRLTSTPVRPESVTASATLHTYLPPSPADSGPSAKVDPRLLARLRQDEPVRTSVLSSGIPVILRLRDAEKWSAPDGFRTQSVLGTIITGRATLEAIAQLSNDPNVMRLEGERGGGVSECGTSVPFVRARTVHRRKPKERGDQALIAVIDTGCDVLHKAFLDDAGQSRIVEIWDQRSLAGPTPLAVRGAGYADYGRIHTAAEIAAYLAANAVPPGLGRDVDGHGTHVASIAAGRQVGSFSGGVAPHAKLLIVRSKLDVNAPNPFSLGYSQSHLDALAYIDAVATALGLPVVVNVSQGMNAGAHDGSSLLEAGFDAFSGLGRRPGRVVVKSAGNERDNNGHAKLSIGGLAAGSLEWESEAVARPEDIIELWFKASDKYKFQLVSPSDEVSPQLSTTNTSVAGTFPSGNSYEMSYERLHADNGDSRVCITIRPALAPIAPGEWKLDIEAVQVTTNGIIHAWIERLTSRPSIYFLTHLHEEMTLSIPGTAHSVITVGAVHSALPLRTTDSSSYGPTRDERSKPDVVAPGEEIQAARGGTKTAAMSLTGTSMAAPHVAGAIALLLSQRAKAVGVANVPNAQQIRAALRNNSRGFTGHFSPATGYGLLDVPDFLAAFS